MDQLLVDFGFGAAFSGGWWMATQRERESEKIALPPSPTSDSGTAMKVTAQQVMYRPIRRVIEGVGTIHGLEKS